MKQYATQSTESTKRRKPGVTETTQEGLTEQLDERKNATARRMKDAERGSARYYGLTISSFYFNLYNYGIEAARKQEQKEKVIREHGA